MPFDQYATHQPTLFRTVLRSSGDVLELGMGNYTTPILHELCAPAGRRLVSVESSMDWLKQFLYLGQTSFHEFKVVSQWFEFRLEEAHWGVVLVDHEPYTGRGREIARARRCADYIVIHDTDQRWGEFGWGQIKPTFTYAFTDKRYDTWVSVVSMEKPLEFLAGNFSHEYIANGVINSHG